MDEKDMFGADSPIEEVVETVAEQEAPVEQEVPTVEAQPLTAPVVDAKPDPGYVPITVVLDEREKRKELEAQLRQLQQQQPREQPKVPDPLDDPEGFREYQTSYAANQALNVKLELSEDVARDKFGDELVDKARDWALQRFGQNPGFQAQVFAQRNPYKFVVEQYQREQIASQVSLDDFAQFQAWKAAQAQVAPAPAAPVAATPPPASLVNAPSAGSPKPPKADPVAEKLAAMF